MNRPTGVTILAVLDFIGAGIEVLGAIAMFIGGAFIGAILARVAARSGGAAIGAGAGAAIGIALGVVFLFMACISGAIGFGMWNLKEWGRILQMVFAGIGAAFQALGFLASLFHPRLGAMLWNLIWLSFNAAIIYYLIQPQIKAAFAQAGPMQQAAGR